MNDRFLIIGGGIAGLTAAETIRQMLPEAEITLACEEPDLPYTRPLLSKVYLKTLEKEKLYIHPASWYTKNQIRLLLNARAVSLDPAMRTVTLEDGIILSYDKLIYALGAAPFMPPYPYIPAGVFPVRTLADIAGIHRYAAVAENAVVIGGGVIGLEMAWELKQMGLSVTVLELAPRLLSRQLDSESAAVITGLMKEQGVAVHTGVTIEGFLGDADGNVSGVCVRETGMLPAELVIMSAGVRPRKELAEAAGLSCGRGVRVDDELCSSDPCIYAAGDCVEGRFINPALWNYSEASGRIAAWNASGVFERKIFEPTGGDILLHSMGTALFSTGCVNEGENNVVGHLSDGVAEDPLFRVNTMAGHKRHYEKRFYQDGRLAGAVLIGNLGRMQSIREEIANAKETKEGSRMAPVSRASATKHCRREETKEETQRVTVNHAPESAIREEG
ncbi:MAG: NAD(P)/FAD-dependent oxidoreductase [Lachnospiraceae bacterium]|nr:NAD(P)/FAD-dependent oxidoreductase [Lachnospiraceae bacterium]